LVEHVVCGAAGTAADQIVIAINIARPDNSTPMESRFDIDRPSRTCRLRRAFVPLHTSGIHIRHLAALPWPLDLL
jgi:hypothetical protein